MAKKGFRPSQTARMYLTQAEKLARQHLRKSKGDGGANRSHADTRPAQARLPQAQQAEQPRTSAPSFTRSRGQGAHEPQKATQGGQGEAPGRDGGSVD